MKPTLKKFGMVTEEEDGVIVLEGFHVDMKDSDEPACNVLLQLVIERMQNELRKLKQGEPSETI